MVQMTSAVVISYSGTSVDFNSAVANHIMVTHRLSNPIIFIPTPAATGAVLGTNNIAMNLGFFDNAFDLSFQLHDGPGTFNFTSPTTAYEKLVFMAADPTVGKQPKTLTLNGTAFTGHIESLRVPFQPGQKDLVIMGTLSFRLTANLPM
jgi:hypothetical protein